MDVHIQSDAGKITDVVIFSDSLHPAMIELLTASLKGKTSDKPGIDVAIRESHALLNDTESEQHVLEFRDWLVTAI